MRRKKTNYGLLSDVSKEMNLILGDQSGRSVSRRTAQGLKRTFELRDYQLSDDDAEHIVHGCMVTTGLLLKSEKASSNLVGCFLLGGLIGMYHNGL